MIKKLSKILLLIAVVSVLAAGCKQERNPETQPLAPAEQQAEIRENGVSYKGEEGKTALELLKAKYNVQTQFFKGIGDYVERIEGVGQDSSHFWQVFVNGEPAKVGASTLITHDGDTIEWKLTELKTNAE
jgi:hypothetical protein